MYTTKAFPGMAESTFLSRSFGDQGVRLRIRKEARTQSVTVIRRSGAKLSIYRKRPSSRGHGGGDSQGYSAGQRPSVSSTPGSLGYSAGSAYTPNSAREYQGEFQEPPGKRQRSVGPGDRGMYARPQGQDAWAYSQGQQPVNPYGTHSPATAYGQETVPTSQQPGLAYRGNPPESGMGYVPRPPMSEYSTPPQQQVAYDQHRGYGQQESPAGQYGDVSNRLAQMRHGHPAEQMQFPDINYEQQSMMANRNQPYPYHQLDQRQRYGAAGATGSHTLPPLGSSAPASGQSALAANPAFQMASDPRYASQPQGQRDYNGYQSGMPIKEEY